MEHTKEPCQQHAQQLQRDVWGNGWEAQLEHWAGLEPYGCWTAVHDLALDQGLIVLLLQLL